MRNLIKANVILQRILLPPQVLHWKTPLLISLFFFLFSALEIKNKALKDTLADCSWLFLTIGIGWRTSQEPFIISGISLSPWITGALISWFLSVNLTPDRQSLAVVFWPLISICLAVIIKFIDSGAKLQPPPPLIRPIFLVIILTNTLLTCFLAFHFIIQDWLQQYPSVLAEDFTKSGFVVNFKPPSLNNSRGMTMLKVMENQLRLKTRKRSWQKVEEWLIAVSRKQVSLRNQMFKNISPLAENSKWDIETYVIQGQSLYKIEFLARWRGPSTKPGGYTLSKDCEVAKVSNRATVNCDPIKIYNPTRKIDRIKGVNKV
ncbi:DUF5357 family protein [Kamptonema animale CS-326]|jgi:hypothetical protein|uniref:DUF5357 family protein n=1 Tax=Kamptonema animale TaxID=92934 RepID=UPI00232E57B0|nr:DUF5357 family protein [Kamptonema animale]MDB9512067.1 DUF5357 family protein [Kamptonema animale CS-326]